MLSLPLTFATTVDTIPADIPYIHPPADRIDAWKRRLPHEVPLVGLAWSGNPATTRDRDRSIAFEQLAPVLAVPGLRFVSLQKDVRAADVGALRDRSEVIDVGADLNDFADTCAVVSQLDLVITVDTSVAHLAGALGKPVWVLLAAQSDWRWMLGRPDSPWYPTMQLFRQTTLSDWKGAIERVGAALRVFQR